MAGLRGQVGPPALTPAEPRLLGAAEIRDLAARLGLRPTKQRGQNFVIDPNTVRRIVRESGVGPDDVVVEIGPGLGSLTLGLLGVARRVVAVEIDPRLAGLLPDTAAAYAPDQVDRLDVVLADALRIDAVPGEPRPPWCRICLTTSPCRCCCTCSRPFPAWSVAS